MNITNSEPATHPDDGLSSGTGTMRILRCISLGATMLLSGSFLLSSCSSSTKVVAGPDALPTVAVVKVIRGDLENRFETAAEFRPYQQISEYAKVSGYVHAIYVDIGDRVHKGQLLAVLEIPELVADLDHARAGIKRSEQERKRAQGELDRAKSAHNIAHLAYTRLAGVANSRPGLVAQQEIDAAEAHDRETEAQVAAAEAGLASAQEQLQVDKATLAREQSLADYSKIVAPFDGVVTQRYADTGAMLAAGTSSEKQALPLVQLAQDNVLRLDIPVPESIVPSIRVGTPVTLTVSVLNRTYQAQVVRLVRQLDASTRTMTTEIDVPNPKLELVPGMYATASIALERKEGVLVVPVEAISRQENRVTVFRLNTKNEIEERTVQLGLGEPARVEVRSGLNEGDLIVVGQRSQVRAGEKVNPKIVPAGAAEGGT